MISKAREQADRLLTEFGSMIGLDGFALDETGHARLAFDEVFVSLDLREEDGSLVLVAPLGEPPERTVENYGRLLDANLHWAGTGGSTLAREPATGVIVLQHAIALDGLDESSFETAVRGFVDAAERLAALVATPPGSGRANTPSPAESDFTVIQA